jgi:probable phosphoglycerate mutase
VTQALDLILVRHGETDWNRELRFQGQLDVPLNAIGLEQATRVAQALQALQWHTLISSDLSRAVQTAQALHTLRPHSPWQREPQWREQHFGQIEGRSTAEIKASDPQAWAQWIRFEADYAFPGGECQRDFHARIEAALHALAVACAAQSVVLVTHGGVLDMIYRSALGESLSGPRRCEIPNAGISRVRVQRGQIEIVSWADTRHLQGMGPQPVYDQQKLASKVPAQEG